MVDWENKKPKLPAIIGVGVMLFFFFFSYCHENRHDLHSMMDIFGLTGPSFKVTEEVQG